MKQPCMGPCTYTVATHIWVKNNSAWPMERFIGVCHAVVVLKGKQIGVRMLFAAQRNCCSSLPGLLSHRQNEPRLLASHLAIQQHSYLPPVWHASVYSHAISGWIISSSSYSAVHLYAVDGGIPGTVRRCLASSNAYSWTQSSKLTVLPKF